MKKLLLLLIPLYLQAQNTQRPDCFLPVNIPVGSTLPFNVGPFDNRTAGCIAWTFVYNSYTYSALSIVVQTAPNVSAGVPGSWSTFAAVTGSNPGTNTTKGGATFGGDISGYFPWVRVQLTSATGAGTISGELYGWRNPAVVTSTVVIPGTVVVEGDKSNNAVPPGATNLGVLPGLANSAAPTWTEGDQVTESMDLSGRQRVLSTSAGNPTVLSGQQAVTAAAVALATNTAKAACVKALVSNSINVFVGPAAITTSTGYLLAPGESVCLPVTNTNLLFVIASTTGASVSWAATN